MGKPRSHADDPYRSQDRGNDRRRRRTPHRVCHGLLKRAAPLLEQEGPLRQRRSWGGQSRMIACERPPRRFAPPLLYQEESSMCRVELALKQFLFGKRVRAPNRGTKTFGRLNVAASASVHFAQSGMQQMIVLQAVEFANRLY